MFGWLRIFKTVRSRVKALEKREAELREEMFPALDQRYVGFFGNKPKSRLEQNSNGFIQLRSDLDALYKHSGLKRIRPRDHPAVEIKKIRKPRPKKKK